LGDPLISPGLGVGIASLVLVSLTLRRLEDTENAPVLMGKPWENHGKTMGKPWENGGLPNLVMTKSLAIEHGPVEIVDLPIKHGDFP